MSAHGCTISLLSLRGFGFVYRVQLYSSGVCYAGQRFIFDTNSPIFLHHVVIRICGVLIVEIFRLWGIRKYRSRCARFQFYENVLSRKVSTAGFQVLPLSHHRHMQLAHKCPVPMCMCCTATLYRVYFNTYSLYHPSIERPSVYRFEYVIAIVCLGSISRRRRYTPLLY